MTNNQIEAINAIKNIIETNEQQTKLLKTELRKLEDSIPKLTIHLGIEDTYVFKTKHINCYPENIINMMLVYHSKNTKELLHILFDNDNTSDTYEYIYNDVECPIFITCEILGLLRKIYHIANEVNEKERIKKVYNIFLAKNMHIINFVNNRNNLTEDIIIKFMDFCEYISWHTANSSIVHEGSHVLLYLVKNKLAYAEVYDKVMIEVKEWISGYYAYMYTIE